MIRVFDFLDIGEAFYLLSNGEIYDELGYLLGVFMIYRLFKN